MLGHSRHWIVGAAISRQLDGEALVAALARRRDLERRAPPLAAWTRQRLHSDHASITAALGDQRRQRHQNTRWQVSGARRGSMRDKVLRACDHAVERMAKGDYHKRRRPRTREATNGPTDRGTRHAAVAGLSLPRKSSRASFRYFGLAAARSSTSGD